MGQASGTGHWIQGMKVLQQRITVIETTHPLTENTNLLRSESQGFGGDRKAASTRLYCKIISLVVLSGPKGTIAINGVILASSSSLLNKGTDGAHRESDSKLELRSEDAGLDQSTDPDSVCLSASFKGLPERILGNGNFSTALFIDSSTPGGHFAFTVIPGSSILGVGPPGRSWGATGCTVNCGFSVGSTR